ncbi:hypothetical protein Tco_0678225 [Tanacetum coccineum]|uniref:Uncharacterized protein n=1 Tax=Tanacetum coccineum TaxID=301880 RepID=A0ABQ4XFS7_9ASTR
MVITKAYRRKFKSSANKNNHVSDCNANVKNVALSKNSDTICLSCNECLFSTNHDACVVQYLKKMQKRKVAKSAKQKVKREWKPTGGIFTSVGLRWKPTGRVFNMEGKICPIIKTSPATIVPLGNRLHTIRILAVAPNARTRMKYSIAKNSLIRAHINRYGHPFNPPNFTFIINSAILEQSSWNFGFIGIVEIVLWYLDSGCSKHMTGHRDKLINFVSKFIRMDDVCLNTHHFSPSDESMVHIEVLLVLWGNRLLIPDGSLPLSRPTKFTGIRLDPVHLEHANQVYCGRGVCIHAGGPVFDAKKREYLILLCLLRHCPVTATSVVQLATTANQMPPRGTGRVLDPRF